MTEEQEQIDRRELLKRVGFVAGAAAVLGGGCLLWPQPAGEPVDSQTESVDPWDVLREVQAALRTSPDHLVARADRLVEAQDLEAIYAFVRDEVLALPSGDRGLSGRSAYEAARWGVRATLRGGAGTPREKAELLAELFRRAGHEAEVVVGRIDAEHSDLRALLLRPVQREFQPEISDEQLARWRALLGLSETSDLELPQIDPGWTASDALADELLAAIPPEQIRSGHHFDWRWLKDLPIVRVQVDGAPVLANPFVSEGVLGTSYLQTAPDQLQPAPPYEFPRVEVTLEAGFSSAPQERVELVSRSWTQDELAGRQVLVQTLPGARLDTLARISFAELRTFVPALALQGVDLELGDMKALSALGDPFTIDGSRLVFPAEGPPAVDGLSLAPPAGASPRAEQVASLELKVNAGRFPDVVVRARALDADGAPVEGLTARELQLSEDGHGVPYLLKSNTQTPRVLLLFDRSMSMPTEFHGERAEAFSRELTAALEAAWPGAVVNHWFTSSELWEWLAKASATEPTAIVYVTDGDVSGEASEAMQAAIRQGPPVVLLDVGDKHQVLDEMAELSGGVRLPAAEHPQAVEAVRGYLQEREPEPYVFVYTAPGEGPAQRALELSAQGGAQASASYEVPTKAFPPPRLSGLYLTIEANGQRVTRTLAGKLHGTQGSASQAELLDVRGALFGATYLGFEGYTPPASVWLDDLIASKLALQPFVETVAQGDLPTQIEAFESGLIHLPAPLFTLLPPLWEDLARDERGLTYPTGLQTTLFAERVVFDAPHVLRRVDVLPFGRLAVAPDVGRETPEECEQNALSRYRIALRQSARVAVAEEALGASTTARLRGQPLKFVHAGGGRSAFSTGDGLSQEQVERWSALLHPRPGVRTHLLVPADGKTLAFWEVDMITGAATGILHDGSGAGREEREIRRLLKEIEREVLVLNALASLTAAAGGVGFVGGIALGIVGNYGQMLARLYAAVSITIAVMNTGNLGAEIADSIREMTRNVQKTIFYGAFGRMGLAVSTMDAVITLLLESDH